MLNFDKRKKDILSKKDKSFIGEWDEKIKPLCDKINKKKNYYTTSSCAGRIVLVKDQEKKQPGVFEAVFHDIINFKSFWKKLSEIASPCSEIVKKVVNNKGPSKFGVTVNKLGKIPRRGQNVKFKQEPCILHVACKDFKDAEGLLKKAQLAGWKRSGIIASGKRFIVEIGGTDKLEFPLMQNGKLVVNDSFLKLVVKKSNENLKKSWLKIDKLKKLI